MTTLRNFIAHLLARWYVHRHAPRSRVGQWFTDPNADGRYDAPPVTRK